MTEPTDTAILSDKQDEPARLLERLEELRVYLLGSLVEKEERAMKALRVRLDELHASLLCSLDVGGREE